MKISIDIVIPYSGDGGIEKVIKKLITYLYENGYRVRLVEMVHEYGSWIDNRIPFFALSEEHVESIFDFISLYENFMKKTYVPDLIIASPWPFMAYATRIALENIGQSAKLIAWLHGPVETYEENDCGGIACLSYADQTWVLNEKSRWQIKNDTPQMNVVVVKNPLEISRVNHEYATGKKRLVYVGRLSTEKNIDVIVSSISRCSDWKLTIVGDGNAEYRRGIEELIAEKNIGDRVEMLGWKANPWLCIKEATALVLASSYEAFPSVMIEALARGIPVFSTPVDGVVEVIKSGINGYLYSGGDNLCQLLNNYGTDLLPAINAEVCKESVSGYEEEKVLKELEGLINKIMEDVEC